MSTVYIKDETFQRYMLANGGDRIEARKEIQAVVDEHAPDVDWPDTDPDQDRRDQEAADE